MKDEKFCYKALYFCILTSFILGKYLLNDVIGIPYYHEGGNPLFKIHLYSYILIFSIAYLFFKLGFKVLFRSLKNEKSLIFYVVSVFLVSIIGILTNGLSGLAFVIDTLLSPALAVFLISRINLYFKMKLFKLILLLLVLNSTMAIMEFALGMNFIPREQPVWEFRSWALLSHPLNNALITSSLIILLLFPLRGLKKVYIYLLLLIALLSFGGRAAFVLVSIYTIFYISLELKTIIFNKRKFSFKGVIITHFSIYIAVVVISVSFILGIGERIFTGLELDDSARTRLDVFNLLYMISPKELFFGVENSFSLIIEETVGVETIENVWLGWLFQFGLLGTIPLILSLLFMLFSLANNMKLYPIVTLFLLVCSANNSLSTKTPALLIFTLSLVIISEYMKNVKYTKKRQYE